MLSVSNLLVTLAAGCSGSVHVHKDHLKDSFLPFHPCILPSVSPPPLSCFLYRCGSAHRADGCLPSKRLKGVLCHFSLVVQPLGGGTVAAAPGLFFCVWHWSPGLSPGSWVPQFLCLPGMGAAVERLSLAPSPRELNMPHDNAMLPWHMSSMGPGTQVMLRHECTGLLHSGT